MEFLKNAAIWVGLFVGVLGVIEIYQTIFGRKKKPKTKQKPTLPEPKLNKGSRELYAQLAARGYKPVGFAWGSEHGSAYFLTPTQEIELGLGIDYETVKQQDRSDGLPYLMIGFDANDDTSALLKHDTAGHLLTIAPTRSGKGVAAVIPNLLMYQGSMVVLDVKQENAHVTSIRRAALFAQNDGGSKGIHGIFAPWGKTAGGSWNPMDLIDSDEDNAWEDAREMAELLIVGEGSGDSFWINEAKNLLTGLLMYMHLTSPAESKNLSSLYGMIAQDKEEFELLLAEMAAHANPQVSRSATSYANAEERVKPNIVSTLNSQLAIWNGGKLAKVMDKTTIDFSKIKYGTSTVYLCIPPDKLRTYAALTRLFMGLCLRKLMNDMTRPKLPVVFMLDEFPTMGRVKAIEEGVAYLAGYGIKLWMFAQDLKQLRSVYGDKADSILANCQVKQFFGVSDFETAKYVSDLCGQTTIPVMNFSSSFGQEHSSHGDGVSSVGRPLMSPDDVMNMKQEDLLVLVQNTLPIKGAKLPYYQMPWFYQDKFFNVAYRENPYHE